MMTWYSNELCITANSASNDIYKTLLYCCTLLLLYSALVYHPVADRAVTTSKDCTFKIWVMQLREDSMDTKPTTASAAAAGGKQSAAAQAAAAAAQAAAAAGPAVYWSCAISVSYKTSLPAQAAAFSSDGSLLAVTFAGIVTLWGSAAAARAAAAAAAAVTSAVSLAAIGDAPAPIEATGGRSSSGNGSSANNSGSAAVALLGTLLSDAGVTRPGDVVVGDRAAQHSLAFLPKSSSLLVRDRGSAALWDVISAVQRGAGPKWSYKGSISSAAAVDSSSASSSSSGLRVGRRTGNVALCIDRSGKGQGGGCTVVLLSADSSVPLYSWRLASAVRSMVFTLPSTSSNSNSSSSSSSDGAARAGLVVLTHSGDVQLLSVSSTSTSSSATTASAGLDGAGVMLRPTAPLAGALPLSGKRKLILLSEGAEAQQQQQQQQPAWRAAGASPLLLDNSSSSTGEFTSLLSDTATVHLPPATELLGSYLRSHLRAAPAATAAAAGAGAAAGASSATLPLRNGALNGVLAKGSVLKNGVVRGGSSNGRALGIDPTLLALFSKHMAATSDSN
jgi:trimeric autotransporter adhesin